MTLLILRPCQRRWHHQSFGKGSADGEVESGFYGVKVRHIWDFFIRPFTIASEPKLKLAQ